MNNLAQLHIDRTKCSGCGRCVLVCPGSLFFLDPSHHAAHHPIERFGWDGCWKCQHCLAVCPNGAIASTYFELLCAAHGLGAILMSFCLDVLKRMPDVWSLLHIPDDHCVSMAIGFGYPMIPYARGVQREDTVRSEVLSFPAGS